MRKLITKLSRLILLSTVTLSGAAIAGTPVCYTLDEYQGVYERNIYWAEAAARASEAKAHLLKAGAASVEASMNQLQSSMEQAQQQLEQAASGNTTSVGGGNFLVNALNAYSTYKLGKEIDAAMALAISTEANKQKWEAILAQCEVDVRDSLFDQGYDEADYWDNCTDDYISVILGRCDPVTDFLDLPEGEVTGTAGCTLIYDENNNVVDCVGGNGLELD